MSYFNFREMCKTSRSVDNYPRTMEQVHNMCVLVDFLDMVREEFGEPIIVNSGFRSEEVNVAVGGARRSLHLQGRAADIRPGYYPANMYYDELSRLYKILYAYKGELSELIKHDTYIHIAI